MLLSFKKLLIISSCFLFLAISYSPKVFAQKIKCIVITDKNAQKDRLCGNNSMFVYSGMNWKYPDSYPEDFRYDHFEIVVNQEPRRSIWVNFSQIEIAEFKKQNSELHLNITLNNGKMLSGIFPASWLKISGEGDLGTVTYDIEQVNSIEFVKFYGWKNIRDK